MPIVEPPDDKRLKVSKFRSELGRVLASAGEIGPSPIGENAIAFQPNTKEFDAAQAFLKAYRHIHSQHVAGEMTVADAASEIASVFSDTLGSVLHKPEVRQFSRKFFEQTIKSGNPEAFKKLDKLMGDSEFDGSQPVLQITDMMARLVLLPLAMAVQMNRDRVANKAFSQRLEEVRALREMEAQAIDAARRVSNLDKAAKEYASIADQWADPAKQTIEVKVGTVSTHLPRQSPELQSHLSSVERRLMENMNATTKALDIFEQRYDAIEDSGKLQSVTHDSVRRMMIVAKRFETGELDVNGQVANPMARITESADKLGVGNGSVLRKEAERFERLLNEDGVQEKLRERALKAAHAVIDFDVERVRRGVDRATVEGRPLNQIELASMNTMLREVPKAVKDLHAFNAGEHWSSEAQERELSRMKKTFGSIESLSEYVGKSQQIGDLSDDATKKKLEDLSKMGDSLKKVVEKLFALFGWSPGNADGAKGPAAP